MNSVNQLHVNRLQSMVDWKMSQEHVSHYMEAEISALCYAIEVLTKQSDDEL